VACLKKQCSLGPPHRDEAACVLAKEMLPAHWLFASSHDQSAPDWTCGLRDAGPRAAQRAHTDVVGLALVGKEKDRRYFASKLGHLTIELRQGSAASCRKVSFEVAPLWTAMGCSS
jgi:hypothetical protein